jgi:dTMP kinase
MTKGKLISFEGLDGAGKTTQIDLLERWFTAHSLPCIRTREPGGTPLGQEIRQLLFGHSDLILTPLAETFLFQADRAQHFATLILPTLADGTHVITDRSFDSSIAYQGAARGVGESLVEQLSLIATQGHAPDLTILLDLDATKVSQRTNIDHNQRGQREEQSRFDRESEQFHFRLRAAFLTLARAHSERIKVIDASQAVEQIHLEIVALVSKLVL